MQFPSKTRTYATLLLFLAFRAFGNLWLTMGARHFPQTLGMQPLAYLNSMIEPLIALGVLMLLLSTFARLALLSLADLAFVLPVTAVGYVLAAVLGKFYLAEQISPQRWLAILLIFAGAVLVGSTSHKTTAAVKVTAE